MTRFADRTTSSLTTGVDLLTGVDGVPKFICEMAFGNRPGDTANTVVVGTVTVGTAPLGAAVTPDGKTLYVANKGSNSVSVIDVATNTLTTTVTVGSQPHGLAITPDGSKVYVANWGAVTVSVIATATNTVTTTISSGLGTAALEGVAITPDGTRAYVTNSSSPGVVYVITTASNTVTASISVGDFPLGVAVTPDGARVYVGLGGTSNKVAVIATATNTVTTNVTVGTGPEGVAITPDGTRVYVANQTDGTVSVIATATNTVTATVTVGAGPVGVAISTDGANAYVANFSASNSVSVIATATNTVSSTIPVGAKPYGMAITPDDAYVYATNNASNTVSVIALATVVWTDVSAYLRGFSIKRGRQYELNAMQAGTCDITLKNLDRRFDPSYSGSPYYPNVKPMVPVRISAVYQSTTYRLFTGYAERFPQNRTGPSYAETQVQAVDGFELLSSATLPTPGAGSYPQELSGSRVARVLNAIGWSASARSIATGQSQVTSYAFLGTDAVPALQHLLDVADSELGTFLLTNDGSAKFLDRHSLYTATSQATFTDQPSVDTGAIGYADIVASIDKDLITNQWIGTRTGGTPQIALDSNSIKTYFTRTQSRTPLLPDDASVKSAMQTLLSQYRTPTLRISEVTVRPGNNVAAWTQVLARDLTDRVTIREHPPGGGSPLVQDSFIQSIDLTVSTDAAGAKVAWGLLPTGVTLGAWQASISAVGTGTIAGF